MTEVVDIKIQFLNTVADLGSCNAALKRLGLTYTQYRKWEQDDLHFSSEVKIAEKFYIDGINAHIAALAKRRLFEVLENGVTEVTTQRKTLEGGEYDDEGNRPSEVIIKRVHRGVPSWAIKQGLDLIPSLTKAVEKLVDENALPSEKLVQVQNLINGFEEQLRCVITGETEQRQLTDDIIKQIQSTALS